MTVTADDGTLQEVAQLIGREVRDTDLIGHTDRGTLALVLLDADFEHSERVINRLVSRIENYEFPTQMRIAVGAACYPDPRRRRRLAEASGAVPADRELAGRSSTRPPIRTEVAPMKNAHVRRPSQRRCALAACTPRAPRGQGQGRRQEAGAAGPGRRATSTGSAPATSCASRSTRIRSCRSRCRSGPTARSRCR